MSRERRKLLEKRDSLVIFLESSGYSKGDIAIIMNVSRMTVYRVLRENRLSTV